MNSFENSRILLENISGQDSISAEDLTNVFCRIIEDAQRVGQSEGVRDVAVFAGQVRFLCGELAELIDGHREVFDNLRPVLKKQLDQNQQTIETQEKVLSGYQKEIDDALKSREEVLTKQAEAETKLKEHDEAIEELQKAEETLAEAEKDLAAREELLMSLTKEKDGLRQKLMEYESQLTAIGNAWRALCESPGFRDMTAVDDAVKVIDPSIGSFRQLEEKLEEYGKALEGGVEAYTETYKKLVDMLKSKQNEET